MKNNKEYVKWGLTAFLVVLGAFAGYYVIFHLDNLSSSINKLIAILMPIVDGLILAYLLTPLVNFFERQAVQPLIKMTHIKAKQSHSRQIGRAHV